MPTALNISIYKMNNFWRNISSKFTHLFSIIIDKLGINLYRLNTKIRK